MSLPNGTYDVSVVVNQSTPPEVRRHLEGLWKLAMIPENKVIAAKREYRNPSICENDFCHEFGSSGQVVARNMWDVLYRCLRPSTTGACVGGHLEVHAVQDALDRELAGKFLGHEKKFSNFDDADISRALEVLEKLTREHSQEE